VFNFKRTFEEYKKICIKHNLPLIDLSRSFNYANTAYYGSTPIEPSNLGIDIICKLIKHIINLPE
jgi:hypothetical protein